MHGTPSYSQDAIRKAIDLFIDFLNTKSGNENLHGLSVAIFSALQELLVDKIYRFVDIIGYRIQFTVIRIDHLEFVSHDMLDESVEWPPKINTPSAK